MASSTISTAVIMAAILFFSSVVTVTQAQATETCAQNLIPCGAYLNTTTTPPDTCCSSIKDAVANDLTCLCNLYNTPGLLESYGVILTQALALTSRCSVNGDLSACSKSSADSPSGSTTPGLSSRVIAGISIAGVLGSLLLISCVHFGGVYRMKKPSSLSETYSDDEGRYGQHGYAHSANIIVDKSVEFSYQELATATNDFNISNKIAQGGFGTVFYAQLSGKSAAIKKMEMEASKEFLAELNVLTHVHHLNLVHLIGYCLDRSLCLVYEFIKNGNLSQHLRGSDRDPLPWLTRVQIALDSARGLQYIHEHTVPGYIHRDVKSTNILIDENFRGKVADFGLTVLTELGNARKPRRAGTFGYMPPEYAENGDVSPKTDVYAFGVVLYELISAKQAVLETKQIISEFSTQKEKIITLYKTITDLFEDVLSQPDPRDELCKLIDPRLGDNYPIDSIHKMAQLAKACTHENPQLRPSMSSIVTALITLSSSTENWDEKSKLSQSNG